MTYNDNTNNRDKRLAKRHLANRRFRWYGVFGLSLAMAALILLLGTMAFQGFSAFRQAQVRLQITFTKALVDPKGDGSAESLARGEYLSLIKNSLSLTFPDVQSRSERMSLVRLLSEGAQYQLQKLLMDHPHWVDHSISLWLTASDEVDMWIKDSATQAVLGNERQLEDQQAAWIATLKARGELELRFNRQFFTGGDSRNPEMAGILGAVKGTFLTLLITLLVAFPLGVATAVYLGEFARKGAWSDFIEVNINNLAAVPSVIFGLLGLALYLNLMHLPRSASMVGGLTLALMTLPTMVIATRAALRSVPEAIREGACAIGASPLQVVSHHVLPLATPGMLTGTILGLARALGESAPLLMIGMVAFIMDIPSGVMDPVTVLPVQIFLWADSPERAFMEKTAGATIILLIFLIVMNALAVFLRNRFERRW